MPHRYFTQDITGHSARLCGPEAHHLAKVMRAKPGQPVLLCDGAGTDYDAVITQVLPDEVLFEVHASRKSVAEPSLWAEVFIGMAKGERMDFAVQKSVELGASAIRPFFSQNSVVKPKNEEAKTQRYTRIAHEAAKQCGRGLLPQVYPPVGFGAVLDQAKICEKTLFLYEAGGVSLWQAVQGGAASVALITGPEGGFAPAEAEAAQKAGFTTVGLGPRILRCETAPAAVLAAVMALTGNLEDPEPPG